VSRAQVGSTVGPISGFPVTTADQLQRDIYDFRLHFDQIYLGCIPRLLDEEGMFLAFLSFLTAVDILAGVFSPAPTPGARFRSFAGRFLPDGLGSLGDELWKARNLMVHSFNPGQFGLVCGQSRLHLSKNHNITTLNAQDVYAALVTAARAYFDALRNAPELQQVFAKRIAETDGGAPETHIVCEY
jgi:hypothetical protein